MIKEGVMGYDLNLGSMEGEAYKTHVLPRVFQEAGYKANLT